ncbi:hypothetical protein BDW42DRAFT_176932 [Aspergillus taichungensis]|uniref:Transcription factor TFIIIC triple barrel domain-containing protein n=1 Tax=Aspergillus taichungensis TaxID=482145 RepID=A0A2J5HJZ3_9EURO|nr:hypothetical protein BDW42DRAFT_176932 [Aspergillus taichungensis]
MQAHSEPASVLDPALLADTPLVYDQDLDPDYEYEYEYDEQETETFYLNLDLTSHNGPIRPPRKRHDSAASTTTPAQSSSATALTPQGDDNETTLASTETDQAPAERVQILGLHTRNPIVSYQNQIFSCSWADQIGTELLFTHPELAPAPEPEPEPDSEPRAAQITPLKRTKDFDLLAANSVKILGRKANLISSAGPAGTVPTDPSTTSSADGLTGGASTPGPPPIRRTGPASNNTNQARFLDRLISLKQAKGETDPVRKVFSLKRTQNLEDRFRGWVQTDEQLAEISRLNDAATQGNTDAIAQLEHLYAQMGSREAVEDAPPER